MFEGNLPLQCPIVSAIGVFIKLFRGLNVRNFNTLYIDL